jgi:hypothetical protein
MVSLASPPFWPCIEGRSKALCDWTTAVGNMVREIARRISIDHLALNLAK